MNQIDQMKQMPNPQPSQQEQDVTNFVLTDYAQKRERKIIYFEKINGQTVLCHKQINPSTLEEGAPIRIAFSANQLAQIRIDRDRATLDLKSQLLKVQEQIDARERENSALYDQLEKDVTEAEASLKDSTADVSAEAKAK